MIEINLIPVTSRKKSHGLSSSSINIPQEFLFGLGGALVLLLVAIHLVLGALWLVKFTQLSSYKGQWQKVLPDKTILDGLGNESKDLKKKMDLISGMTAKRALSWSRKFNIISDTLPKGLWLK